MDEWTEKEALTYLPQEMRQVLNDFREALGKDAGIQATH